jgi:hypothetical protein
MRGTGAASVGRWQREGRLPGRERTGGRLMLASLDTGVGPSRPVAAGRSARVLARAGVPVAGSGEGAG